MNRDWCENKAHSKKEFILNLRKSAKEELEKNCAYIKEHGLTVRKYTAEQTADFYYVFIMKHVLDQYASPNSTLLKQWDENLKAPDGFSDRLYWIGEQLDSCGMESPVSVSYDMYLDDQPLHLTGTLVITDPCYLFPNISSTRDCRKEPKIEEFINSFDEYDDLIQLERYDKRILEYGYPNPVSWGYFDRYKSKDTPPDKKGEFYSHKVEEDYKRYEEALAEYNEQNDSLREKADYWDLTTVGIDKSISRSTLYGDWGCHVFDMETKKDIGQFCADSGFVCVCTLEEVEKLNPEFRAWAESHPWCVTIINNFDGNVWCEVKANEKETDFALTVHGKGTSNGKQLIFLGRQTSL